MKRLTILAVALLPALAADWSDWHNWKYDDQESIKRSFDVPGSGRKLLVDNVSGFIHVTGYDGNQVQVSVQKRINARSPEAIQEAKRDVKLDMSQQGNYVRLYEDGPFRNSSGGTNYRGDDYYGYRVAFDMEIQVPRNIELTVKTLNSPMVVKGTNGEFDIHGLNGGIDMEEIAGSGTIRTLNGKLKVAFAKNPEHDTEFHTLNGAMDVYFKEPLNADLHFKTLNGGVYADFDVSPIPGTVSASQRNGGFYYRSDRSSSARAGKGGPALTFDGLNGAIRLHTKTL
ncbi:conserved exported hypothetical protein [Candidatus Sulfopaludibacter sp. SbA3]|nr:conserved exported hypothetical protein [Candidatus Sulfopaludibacter sp. SbA3]